MSIQRKNLKKKPSVECSDENYSDEELIESILENDAFIRMHPIIEHKVHIRILNTENAKPRSV